MPNGGKPRPSAATTAGDVVSAVRILSLLLWRCCIFDSGMNPTFEIEFAHIHTDITPMHGFNLLPFSAARARQHAARSELE